MLSPIDLGVLRLRCRASDLQIDGMGAYLRKVDFDSEEAVSQ